MGGGTDLVPPAGDPATGGMASPVVSHPGLTARRRHPGDRIFAATAAGAGALVLVTMAAIGIYLLVTAWPAITGNSANLLTTELWRPQDDPPAFGVAAIVFGTAVSSTIAILVGAPIAIGVALAVTNYLPRRVAGSVGALIDLLAAVPSLVFGMWGLYFLIPHTRGFQQWLSETLGWIPIFHHRTASTAGQYGQSLLIAGIVLAIMIIPTVSSVSREVFSRTPSSTMDGALALGATRWEMIRTTVLPFGRAGMVSATMLGLGRALGETIAVALVLNSGFSINWHLTEPGGDTIASMIALKFGEAGSDPIAVSALVLAGLVLFAITLAVNAAARAVLARSEVTR